MGIFNTTVTNGVFDTFAIGSSFIDEAPPLNFLTFVSMSVVLQDTTGTVFSSTALPTTLDLADFNNKTWAMGDNNQGGSASIVSGTLSTLTPAPEPNAVGLLGSGLALLPWVRGARRARRSR